MAKATSTIMHRKRHFPARITFRTVWNAKRSMNRRMPDSSARSPSASNIGQSLGRKGPLQATNDCGNRADCLAREQCVAKSNRMKLFLPVLEHFDLFERDEATAHHGVEVRQNRV